MENYEQKYKDLLERARKMRDENCDGCKICLESLFPELAESDDELTWLTKYIEEEAYSISMDIRDEEDRVKLKNLQRSLAWLEKQENSPILSNSAKTGKNWTEEDEIGSDATIELLEYFINYAPEFRKPTIRRSIDWLESLKKRMEEQQ